MDIVYLLVPLSVVLVFAIAVMFWWSVHNGQFDDLERQGHAILDDADTPAGPVPVGTPPSGASPPGAPLADDPPPGAPAPSASPSGAPPSGAPPPGAIFGSARQSAREPQDR